MIKEKVKELDLSFIKRRREELGYSLGEMAEKMGFSNASVYYKYEKGTSRLRAEHLPALAFLLKCKISDFYA